MENFALDHLPCGWHWAEEANGTAGRSSVAENCPIHFTHKKPAAFGGRKREQPRKGKVNCSELSVRK